MTSEALSTAASSATFVVTIQIRAAGRPRVRPPSPVTEVHRCFDPAQLARTGVDTKPQRLERCCRVLAMKMRE